MWGRFDGTGHLQQAALWRSTKDIEPRSRLIYALDHPSHDDALAMVDALDDSVSFYKLGLELFMAGDYFRLLDEITGRGKQVFVDLKFFDVPETVAAAVRRASDIGATFVTVHGNDAMMRAAAAAKSGGLAVLAVTVLTSLDRGDLDDLGFEVDVVDLVESRAKRALAVGCDGVVSSGLEASRLRESLGERLLVVSPGIRPVDNVIEGDDQKRAVTPTDAFRNGADYIVVGRPIRTAADPRAAAERIQAEIAEVFRD